MSAEPQMTTASTPDVAPSAATGGEFTAEQIEALRPRIVDAIKTVYDPEIPVNIYELGLIYDLDIDPKGNVAIKMTLTAPGCPVAGTMPQMVRDAVAKVEGLNDIDVDLVWDPPWDKSRMSEAAQLELGMF
ncbi:MAG TPA: SUF system Fe-S cluster assembly protein [Dongiaceae bacterium]